MALLEQEMNLREKGLLAGINTDTTAGTTTDTGKITAQSVMPDLEKTSVVLLKNNKVNDQENKRDSLKIFKMQEGNYPM